MCLACPVQPDKNRAAVLVGNKLADILPALHTLVAEEAGIAAGENPAFAGKGGYRLGNSGDLYDIFPVLYGGENAFIVSDGNNPAIGGQSQQKIIAGCKCRDILPAFSPQHRLVAVRPKGVDRTRRGNGCRQTGGLSDLRNIPPAGDGIRLPVALPCRQYGAIGAESKGMVPAGDQFHDISPVRNGIFAVVAVTDMSQQFSLHGAVLIEKVDVAAAAANGTHRFFCGRWHKPLRLPPVLYAFTQQGKNFRQTHRRTERNDTFRRGKAVILRLLPVNGGGVGKVSGKIGNQLLTLQLNSPHVLTENVAAVVAGAEHPQIAVLIKDSKVPAGYCGKIRDLLTEAVGSDNISIVPAEKVGGNGVPRLTAQEPSGDLADGDPCADPIRIVADKGDLLNPLTRTLDTFIFAVVKGNGAVFLQQICHRSAVPRQLRADRLLHLDDAI